MKTRSFRYALVGVLMIVGESAASAQPAPPPAAPPAPPAPAPAAAPAAPAPAAAPPPATAVAPLPAPPPPATTPAADGAAPAAGPEKPATTTAPAPKWYDAIAFDAFIDAYAGINYNFPKPQGPTVGISGGGNSLRAFDVSNGFALNWVGVNASYAADPVGGTVSLRFGPGTRIYNYNSPSTSDDAIGLENVKQAFATWKPGGKDGTFTIDFGKYDQPYGSEIAETQGNINYSRSLLFTYAQPLFFTGFRFDWQATEQLDLKLVVANSWNNSLAPSYGKTAGIQVNFKPFSDLLLSGGYAVGPQQVDGQIATVVTPAGTTVAPANGPGDSSNLRHLVDVIVDYTTLEGKLRFLANGDYVTEQFGSGVSSSWYGANLAVRYGITDMIGIAGRGEYFADPDGVITGLGKGANIIGGTVTLDGKITNNLLLKLEQRIDAVSNDAKSEVFIKKAGPETSKTQMTTMLGIVVKTN